MDNQTTTIRVMGDPFKRFEGIKSFSSGETQTVVKVDHWYTGQTQYTVKKVKWSKYKILNWFIRLYIKIKY